MDRLVAALSAGVEIIDLGRDLFVGMPQSPNHPAFRMALERRHGDMTRLDGSSASNEIIVTGGHVGTHIDALCHVSFNDELYGGLNATETQAGGRFSALGVETIAPIFRRGVLLDVPRALGIDSCEGGYEITVADLETTVDKQHTTIEPGDVVLIRSGWGQLFDNKEAFIGHGSGVPGPGKLAARWLASKSPFVVGAETIAFEHLPPNGGHSLLPAHRILLVEHGIHIIETLDLDALARAEHHEFVFACSPLKLVGATGSPVRPFAIVAV
jgi:kynurenine formamidase